MTDKIENFDSTAYLAALRKCRTELKAGTFMRMSAATSLAEEVSRDTPLFNESLGTPYFDDTLYLVQEMLSLRRTISNSAFVDSVPSFIAEMLKNMNAEVTEEPETRLMPAFRLATMFTSSPSPRLQSIATTLFITNFNELLATEKLTQEEVSNMVKAIIATANPLQIRKLVRETITPDSLLSKILPRQQEVEPILSLSILGPNTSDRPHRMRAILNELTGDQAERVLDSWDQSKGIERNGITSESIYFDHFGAVCQLERRRPGILKLLMETYGISSVARYPLGVLLDQFDKREDQESPYGIIVTARNDHNGVFIEMKDQLEYSFQQMKQLRHNLRILESEDSTNIDEILKLIPKVAAMHGKISLLLLIAHELDPRSGDFSHIRSCLTEKALLGLCSCSTGTKNGTAQKLSQTMKDIDVHAPDSNAFLKDNGITIEQINGQLALKVLFGYDEGNHTTTEDIFHALSKPSQRKYIERSNSVNFYDVPTRVYRNGRLIEDYIS